METAFFVASGLLLVGFALRAKVRIFQVLFIPASVIGGIVGLTAVLALGPWLEAATNWELQGVVSELRTWPGWLIAVIFAGLLIERPGKSFRKSFALAAREGIVVWIIVLGEITLGILATWLVILPFFKVPGSFGQLIEAGFAGGHGTAAAMGSIYDLLAFPPGRDLAFVFATVGLIFGVISGIVYINIAVRRGWTRAGNVEIPLLSGLEARADPQPIAFGRVRSEVIDPLVFQALILVVAFVVGIGFRAGLMYAIPYPARLLDTEPKLLFDGEAPVAENFAEGEIPAPWRALFASNGNPLAPDAKVSRSEPGHWIAAEKNRKYYVVLEGNRLSVYGERLSDKIIRYSDNLPLFMFTLLAGLLVRETMHLLGIGDLIDPEGMRRLTAAAMEFLIVAAVTSLKVSAVVKFGWPVLLLLVLGFVWTGFCLLFLSRRLLPRSYWFELGILNYGMSTGTTAQGMMLLRIIDKDLDSGAAEDYALAAPLSAPFIGGGVITLVVLPWLLQTVYLGLVVAGLVLILVLLYLLGAKMVASQHSED